MTRGRKRFGSAAALVLAAMLAGCSTIDQTTTDHGAAAGTAIGTTGRPPASPTDSSADSPADRSGDRPAAPTPTQTETAAARRSPFVGKQAPAFTLTNDRGRPVSLEDYRGRWVVLYFFPQSDTPGCTCQANEFTTLLQRFHEQEAVVVGVAPDRPDQLAAFRAKYGLKIDLLADPQRQVMPRYGAATPIDIGGSTYWQTNRTTFLIDPRGRIAHHWPEVIPQGHAERVAETLASTSNQ